MKSNRHNIFLDFDCILIFPLTVEKLLKPGHLVINDFPLSLQLGCKNDVTIVVTYDWHRALTKGVDVNAESITSVIHNAIYTWPGLLTWASFFSFFFGDKSDSLATWQKLLL
jgi:hypothetical protein